MTDIEQARVIAASVRRATGRPDPNDMLAMKIEAGEYDSDVAVIAAQRGLATGRRNAADIVNQLREALELLRPGGLCLTNRNVPDDMTVSLEISMGDLRRAFTIRNGEGA